MIADELELFSDDATYTEDHIIYLLGKYRAFLLKQRYADIKKQIPESNYQTICLDLIEVRVLLTLQELLLRTYVQDYEPSSYLQGSCLLIPEQY